MYRTVTTCRACGYGARQIPTLKISNAPVGTYDSVERLIPVFDLGVQPLANDFIQVGEEEAGFAPLRVMFCPRCTLAQLSVVVRPDLLYRHYRYVTSPSQTMRDHFEFLMGVIEEETGSAYELFEIGCNDGALLEAFAKQGYKVCGIDPAENLTKKAIDRGLKVYTSFFDRNATAMMQLENFRPDVILARHVFCHVENWREFILNLQEISKPETLICIEVPWAHDLLQKGEFDTIYHEHTSYLTIKAMQKLLEGSAFRLQRIVPLKIHGGALLLMLRANNYRVPVHSSVAELAETEQCGEADWKKMYTESRRKIRTLYEWVIGARGNGKTVVGYGASAKSTVWINACGFNHADLLFVTDTTLEKMFRRAPGTAIPIQDEGALTRELPDYAVCFAWNYIDEIVRKEKIFLSKGGKFIVPHPDIHTVSCETAAELACTSK